MEPAWKKYLSDHNEGLGLVYERIVLNDCLLRRKRKHEVSTVLEAPLFGMAGVSGINSVALAQARCEITLLDDNFERLEGVRRLWRTLGLDERATFMRQCDFSKLPFADGSFDLVWAWAALWHVPDAHALLNEMARVSRRLVFVAMPNRSQPGYILRRFLLEPDFFKTVNAAWANIARVKKVLHAAGLAIVAEGVLDVPPWPDTVMPAALVLQKLGIRWKRLARRFEGSGWQWSSMDYYMGRRPELKAQMERYAFLERAPLPWQLKTVWAHHR